MGNHNTNGYSAEDASLCVLCFLLMLKSYKIKQKSLLPIINVAMIEGAAIFSHLKLWAPKPSGCQETLFLLWWESVSDIDWRLSVLFSSLREVHMKHIPISLSSLISKIKSICHHLFTSSSICDPDWGCQGVLFFWAAIQLTLGDYECWKEEWILG